MTEDRERLLFEEKTEVVNSWVGKLTNEGKVEPIEPQLVREVLESFGANFEVSEEARQSLEGYTNYKKRFGLNAVWGKDFVDGFKKWIVEEYMPDYEKRTEKEFPTLYNRKTDTYDKIKHSGAMQYFGELTAFAAGEKSFDDYKRLTEDRARKGRDWEVIDPSNYKPSPHSFFPPEFPSRAWGRIKG